MPKKLRNFRQWEVVFRHMEIHSEKSLETACFFVRIRHCRTKILYMEKCELENPLETKIENGVDAVLYFCVIGNSYVFVISADFTAW